MIDAQQKLAEIDELRRRIAHLEEESSRAIGREPAYPPRSYYTIYHLLAGMVLGLIGAASSLLFNVVGSAMVGQHPLQLLRVYLTFPLGEKALELESGFALASGCCLYLATGMIGGIPFHLVLTRFFAGSSGWVRFFAACVLSIGVWLINFYGVLSWLQPLLIGGRWIVERVPVIVAVLTHLVFGLTMLLVSQWGQYTPPSESARRTPA